MESIEAVVAGHLCLDIIPDFGKSQPSGPTDAFRPGSLIEVGPATLSTGGAVSNTGIALHKLGTSVRLIGKVGGDDFGGIVRRIIAGYDRRLGEGIVLDRSAGTSYSVIISRPGMDRIFLHHAGANDTFQASDVPNEALAGIRLFHFGYPPAMKSMYDPDARELVSIFQRAKDAGATTSLDMSLPDPMSPAGRADWRAILRSALPWVDVFLPSLEEILFMLRGSASTVARPYGPELLSDVAREILEMGAKIAVLKLGENGLYLRTAKLSAIQALGRALPPDAQSWADREIWAPCFRVDAAGTTGCGDATIAGFLAGLLRGLSPIKALTAAVAVGACNVEAPDALSGIRSWDETKDRIAGGWPRRDLSVSSPGWRWDAEQAVWIGPGSPS